MEVDNYQKKNRKKDSYSLIKHGSDNDNEIRLLQLVNTNHFYDEEDRQFIYRFIEKGFPEYNRAKYWLTASGASQELENNKNYYKNILNNYPESIPSPSDTEIEKDLDRTFPNEEYYKRKDIKKIIHNILLAYSRRNSNVGYCQGFCFIEETFWLFTQMLERLLPVEHYVEVVGVMTDCAIINQWIKETIPEVYNHLSALGFEMIITNVLFKWFVSLFTQGMNEYVWIPIWDLLFIDGYKVLLRAAVLLFMLAKDQILEKKSIMEINDFFEVEIEHFKPPDFVVSLIRKSLSTDSNILCIQQTREENMPKIKENIKKTKQMKYLNEKGKYDEMENNYSCNLDWPICVANAFETDVIDSEMLVLKRKDKIEIRNDFYLQKMDLRKVLQETKPKKKVVELSIEEKKLAIYRDLLIVRQVHKCGTCLEGINKVNIDDKNNSNKDNSNTNEKTNTPTQPFSLFSGERQTFNVNDIITNVEITGSTVNIIDNTTNNNNSKTNTNNPVDSTISNSNNNNTATETAQNTTSLAQFLRLSSKRQ